MSLWPASMAIFRGVQLSYRNTTCKYNIKMQNIQIEPPNQEPWQHCLGLLGWRSLSVTQNMYRVQTASSINQKTQAVNYSKQIQTEVRNMLHLNKGVPSFYVKGILFYLTICALYTVNTIYSDTSFMCVSNISFSFLIWYYKNKNLSCKFTKYRINIQ